jgi:hypothetical protein
MNMKSIRIQLDTCTNQSDNLFEPIQVQLSTNNGLLWNTIASLVINRDTSTQRPWVISLPDDITEQTYAVRLRLFQRVTTSIRIAIVHVESCLLFEHIYAIIV